LRYFLPAGLSRFAEEARMPDKRTTPDPAERARRRKRPAPTIDLTATEVPVVAADGGPSQPPQSSSAQAQPQATHEAEPESMDSKNSSSKRSTWLSVPALIGGFVGAGAVAIVLMALWFAGAVPVRYAGSADSSAQANALAQRITKIEGMLAKIPANDPSVSERLSAADNAMKSLGIALSALSKHSEEAAAGAADARGRADAAEKAVTQLRNSVQDLTRNTSAGLSPADVDTVQKRLTVLEQAIKSAPVDAAARLALSAAVLRDAIASGAPFVAELDEARSLGADEKTLKLLAPFAANGVPTAAVLGQELSALIPAMLKASGGQGSAGSYLERIEANAGKLVRIRPVGAPTGDDASAVLARTEVEAAHADIDGALADLAKLDAATRAPAQNWIEKAGARQAALAAARQLAGETTHSLGKR
jgi:hypothetical protein